MTRKRSTAAVLAALAVLFAALAVLLPAATPGPASAAANARAPRSFFGVVPQTPLSETDAEYMRGARIGSVRWPLSWGGTQPEAGGEYQWGGFDEVVATAARQHLRVLPFVYSTPSWVARKYTTLPVGGGAQRLWSLFLRAAVQRYGPRGSFWSEHSRASGDFVPRTPIREWQIWNEANFFYFARPASP
ncbi:MAG TPA: hypothetical protein VFG58_10220, partial [Solirubrobacterales bacterium]|nr:hypothetical protein [Solirubrobacterales bacterium]